MTIHIMLAKVIISLQKALSESIRMMWPGAVVLLSSLLISAFFTEFTFIAGLESFWKIFLRFFRLSLVLTLPLLLLPFICSIIQRLLNKRNWHLIHIREEQDHTINPLKSWFIRPFQGIGLAMLVATKLITLLQISTSAAINASTILPTGQFNPGRFLGVTIIAVITSLLLSFIWTLDDLGIRYFNRKTGEIKMIGKYIGFLLPIVFGFYGIFSLFESHAHLLAVLYIAQMVVVLYPPFVIMAVLHSLYIEKYEPILLEKLKTGSRVILTDEQESANKKM
jgi:hypothetical protein